METNTLLGKRIRELRKSRNLSQEQLAEKINTASRFIGFIETGQKAPSLETLKKIAAVFGIELRDLFEFHHLDSADSVTREISALVETASDEQRRRCLKIIRALLF